MEITSDVNICTVGYLLNAYFLWVFLAFNSMFKLTVGERMVQWCPAGDFDSLCIKILIYKQNNLHIHSFWECKIKSKKNKHKQATKHTHPKPNISYIEIISILNTLNYDFI